MNDVLLSPVGIWTVSALVGFAVCVIAMLSAVGDLRSLGEIRNGRRRLAWSNIYDETTRAVILLSWFAMGIAYIQSGLEPRVSAVAWVIIGGNVLLTVNSIRRTLTRSYIRRAAEVAYEHEDPTRISEEEVNARA
jgi:putative exporter of polyketide antibiotics